MPPIILRRALALVAAAAAAVALVGCQQQAEGTIRVLVIGEQAKLRDPVSGPLSAPEAVLLANVAQGLVRFDAAGNIVGGLAERWNVSDDGLSYIFRLTNAEWPGGGKITAQQIARLLKRQMAARSDNALKDSLGAVEDVVAMTDRVIEIRLAAPRPNLLALLAQPELAIVRQGVGTGPFTIAEHSPDGTFRLTREILSADDEVIRREEVALSAADAQAAVRAFARGEADLVLGGTFANLRFAHAARLPDGSLQFDPAAGLFGLVPASREGPFSEPDVRRLLAQAVDRAALVGALNVPGLVPRATVLEPGLDGLPEPVQPAWATVPIAERRAALVAEAARLFGAGEKPIIRLSLTEGPGAQVLLDRIVADWGALGFRVERASSPRSADFRLIDAVAPSNSPAWFLRHFRCGFVPRCDEELDELLDAARAAPIPAQRYALLFQAAGRIDDAQLFIPLTAPVRWSLVSDRVIGFARNRYARHTLTDLDQRQNRRGP